MLPTYADMVPIAAPKSRHWLAEGCAENMDLAKPTQRSWQNWQVSMGSAALQITDDSQSHFGFDQLEKLERGEPVLVCPDVETAEAIASQNIPAVGCDGFWTLELGIDLGGLAPTFIFCTDDYKAKVSCAIDGACSCLLYTSPSPRDRG